MSEEKSEVLKDYEEIKKEFSKVPGTPPDALLYAILLLCKILKEQKKPKLWKN